MGRRYTKSAKSDGRKKNSKNFRRRVHIGVSSDEYRNNVLKLSAKTYCGFRVYVERCFFRFWFYT